VRQLGQAGRPSKAPVVTLLVFPAHRPRAANRLVRPGHGANSGAAVSGPVPCGAVAHLAAFHGHRCPLWLAREDLAAAPPFFPFSPTFSLSFFPLLFLPLPSTLGIAPFKKNSHRTLRKLLLSVDLSKNKRYLAARVSTFLQKTDHSKFVPREVRRSAL